MENHQLKNFPNTHPTLTEAHSLGGETLTKLWHELQTLVAQLGQDGGTLTASIYDTAQVLRYSPPEEGEEPGLSWLIKMQEADGGWGNPVAPLMRDVPTLATILALHQYNARGRFEPMIRAGLDFLRRQSAQWQDLPGDDLPVGVELILPRLAEEAVQKKLAFAFQPYTKLNHIGLQKKKVIQNLKVVHGTPAAFSWEAWGENPSRYILDPLCSVGNSTSATAAWIARAEMMDPSLNVTPSKAYLKLAALATGLNIPGVVPFAWPIDRFEQSFAQYALAIGGLLRHPALAEVVQKQVEHLYSALTSYGMPFSDYFIPDLDDTAAAIIVFRTYGKDVHPDVLRVFKNNTGYFTYPGEFHASTSAHARAVQALSYLTNHAEVLQAQQVLLPFQHPEGEWPGDKWHKSWFYTTSHMLYALHSSPDLPAVEKGLRKLIEGQNEDGGWGVDRWSSTSETAYVLLALHLYKQQRPLLEAAYQRGKDWLLAHIHRPPVPRENLWIGKELFKPYRIDRAFELTALIQALSSSSDRYKK